MNGMNKFTVLAETAWAFGGDSEEGGVGHTGRRRQGGKGVIEARCPLGDGNYYQRDRSCQLRRSGARQSARQRCTSGLRLVFG